MIAKLEKVGIYSKWQPSMKSFDPLSTLSSDHVTDKFQLPQDLWLRNLTEWWVRTHQSVNFGNHKSCGTIIRNAELLSERGTIIMRNYYNVGLLSAKSHNLYITWSHKVMQQMKNVINSFSRDLWLSNLTEGWLMIRSHMSNDKITYPSDDAIMWGRVINELHYTFIFTKSIAT